MVSRSTASRATVRWRNHQCWLRQSIPEVLRGWLLDEGSLTDRLKRCCGGRFSVRVLGEVWRRPQLSEAKVLDMPDTALAWVRHVQLLCDGEPWVFARTVVPVTTLSGAQRRLAYLGNRPLGAYLFADPGMQRSPVQLACVKRDSALYKDAVRGLRRKPQKIWGRRSVFRVGGKPLLVSEIFLPAIESAPERPVKRQGKW
ncbi:Chorismate--pyruvate lyase [hydrothermal vent metagenome]|uniref:Chorismate--pyruvate lyase n=1 Tax=hydrothermal vent metagenome TaxID=652676 RepID=A0A3B0YCQ0_9ZZZZ